jgi:cobalt transporter subunit CbtA
MLFRRLFLCALLAGLCAGLSYSLAQRLQVIPIIAAAEVFESALQAKDPVAVPHGESSGSALRQLREPDAGAGAHAHEEEAWEPQDGLERTFWTVVANALGSTGFALIFLPAFAWWDRQRAGAAASLPTGLLWGAAGWMCFFLWPAIGLRPELPGEAASALSARQAWWLLAVVCAVLGLALLALVRARVRWLGLPVLMLPFFIGAPHIHEPAFAAFSAAEAGQLEALKSQFFTATALANAVQWLALGACAGWLVPRWLRPLLARQEDRASANSSASGGRA